MAQERAGGVAQTAREQAGDVAQTVREQAGGVVTQTARIVAALWAVATAVLASAGRSTLRRPPPPADETVETAKENARRARKPHD
jgi:hypothetical protein